MELKDEFVKAGGWLFRWRSYLPLIMLGLFLLALRDFEYIGRSERLDVLWEAVCLLISLAGLGIRGITVGFTPRGTSGRNTKRQKAEVLNTTGVYSVARNPLYIGNFFMWLGIALFAHSWSLTLIYVLVFCLYYERIIFAEEAFLKEKFGDRFADYARRTPAVIPRFKNWERPDLPFSVRNVLRREYNGFFAVILTLFGLETISELVVKGRLELELRWLFLGAFGLTVWGVLRILKRHTRLLEVKGR